MGQNEHNTSPDVVQEDQTPSWYLMRPFVLRCPGFPFDWLERLRFPRSAAVARQIAALRERKQGLQRAFETTIFPALCDESQAAGHDKQTFRLWYRLSHQVRLGHLVGSDHITAVNERYNRPALAEWLQGWQDLCGELERLTAQGEALFPEELAERRRTLRELTGESQFQEALWLSNPGVYDIGWRYYERHWEPQRRPYKIKHLERRFYTYLQRLSAKNDTASFFGPLNYGSFGEDGALRYRRSPARLRKRQTFFAYWAATKLAELISADPAMRSHLCPRRDSIRCPATADPELALLCELSDGQHSVTEVGAIMQRTSEAVLGLVDQLIGSGWLHLDLPIPPATLHPLDYLVTKVDALPGSPDRDRWLAILAEFQELCTRFSSADLPARRALLTELEERYTRLTQSEARRGKGQMFQDRTMIYEECLGNIEELQLSAAHYEHIRSRLDSVARLCASYSQLLRSSLHDAARALLDDLRPDGGPVPFTTFLSAWRRRYRELPPTPAADQLQQRFTSLVASCSDEHVSRLSAADLLPLSSPSDEPMVLSPDLLLAAPNLEALSDGRYQVVLGELHHGIQPIGWMLSFVDDLGPWEAELSACLPAPTDSCRPANLAFGRRMKTAPPEFAGPTVQVSAVAKNAMRLDLSALVIKRLDGELRLCGPDAQRSLCFYPPSYSVPDALYAPFACFSYPLVRSVPVRLGMHTPRVEIDGLVYQRERWDLPAEYLPGRNHQGTSFQLVLDYIELQQQLGLPDHLFVLTPAEPKPIYIDLQNYFALELLAHLASQSDTIMLVEMWPDPQHLWMTDRDGRYCCELRTVLSNVPASTSVRLPDDRA